MKIDDPVAAQFALLSMYAEDMFDPSHAVLTPPLDQRAAPKWSLIGYLRAKNAVLGAQQIGLGDTVYFGFLAQSRLDPNEYVAALRGTELPIEWLENLQAVPIPHPLAGLVEQGFYSIYGSMQYTMAGANAPPVNAADGICRALPAGAHVTVVGHSLGAALATYLMVDIAQAPAMAVRGALIASPRTGDGDFVNRVDGDVPNYTLYNYIRDLVPHLPPSIPLGFGFQTLPKGKWITPMEAQATIEFDLLCNHHAYCYAAMLDYTSIQGNGPTPCVTGKGM